MSDNILLTKFSEINNGQFSEKNSKNIEIAVLTEEISDLLNKSYVTSIEIFEEDSEEKYEQKIIKVKKTKELLNEIKKIIKDKMKSIVNETISEEDEDLILNDIRIILNVRNIILQKKEKYSKDNSTMLMLG